MLRHEVPKTEELLGFSGVPVTEWVDGWHSEFRIPNSELNTDAETTSIVPPERRYVSVTKTDPGPFPAHLDPLEVAFSQQFVGSFTRDCSGTGVAPLTSGWVCVVWWRISGAQASQ
jgi:hypothetical protein